MCPNCSYSPDWNSQGKEAPPPDFAGAFFTGTLSRELSRGYGNPPTETRDMRGCPKCGHVWMETY